MFLRMNIRVFLYMRTLYKHKSIIAFIPKFDVKPTQQTFHALFTIHPHFILSLEEDNYFSFFFFGRIFFFGKEKKVRGTGFEPADPYGTRPST